MALISFLKWVFVCFIAKEFCAQFRGVSDWLVIVGCSMADGSWVLNCLGFSSAGCRYI